MERRWIKIPKGIILLKPEISLILFLDENSTKQEKILHYTRLSLILTLNIVSGVLFGVYVL